jgi:molecular chaperone DnaJ
MSEVPQPVDWYATLGVAPEATESELRTAWRLLARALHPDAAGDEEAAERFAHAREAWENLSDPARRASHDSAREAFAERVAPLPSGFVERVVGVLRPEPRRGRDLRCELEVPAELAITGGAREVQVPGLQGCEACRGTGLARGARPLCCRRCGGRCFVVTRPVLRATSEPCPRCDAAGWEPERACAPCGGRGRREGLIMVTVEVPAGVRSGRVLRLPRRGLPGEGAAEAGDLQVVVRVADGPWVVEGDDWTATLEVPFWLALAGGAAEALTPWGARVVQLPRGTAEGALLRLAGLGVGRRGDGYLAVRFTWPRQLQSDEGEALRRWGEAVAAREARDGAVVG